MDAIRARSVLTESATPPFPSARLIIRMTAPVLSVSLSSRLVMDIACPPLSSRAAPPFLNRPKHQELPNKTLPHHPPLTPLPHLLTPSTLLAQVISTTVTVFACKSVRSAPNSIKLLVLAMPAPQGSRFTTGSASRLQNQPRLIPHRQTLPCLPTASWPIQSTRPSVFPVSVAIRSSMSSLECAIRLIDTYNYICRIYKAPLLLIFAF